MSNNSNVVATLPDDFDWNDTDRNFEISRYDSARRGIVFNLTSPSNYSDPEDGVVDWDVDCPLIDVLRALRQQSPDDWADLVNRVNAD